MQEQVIRHDHRAHDAHDDGQRSQGHGRPYPPHDGLVPADMYQVKLKEESQAYERDETDDIPLQLAVAVAEEKPAHDSQPGTRPV